MADGGRFGGLRDEIEADESEDTESESEPDDEPEPDNGSDDGAEPEPESEGESEQDTEPESEPDEEPESRSDGQSDHEAEPEPDATETKTDSPSGDEPSGNMSGGQSASDGGSVVTEDVDVTKPGVDYDPSMQRAIYVTDDAWQDHKKSIQFEIERLLYEHGVEEPLGCEIGTAVIETAMERPSEIAERVLERRGLSVDLSNE